MSVSCMVEQDLCPVTRGDTMPFSFTFKQNGVVFPINSYKLFFCMKQKNDSIYITGDVQENVTFPDDADSTNGIGSMVITPVKTNDLIAGVNYYYEFQLVGPTDDVYTVGRGRIKVNDDLIKLIV